MNTDDAENFKNIMNKYELTYILDEYPNWLIDKMRSNILNLLHSLVMNITQANTIYPTCEEEYYDRRKLKKFRKKLDNGEMNYKDIEDSYKSWRGNLKRYSSYHTLKNMDNLYNELFITQFIERGI